MLDVIEVTRLTHDELGERIVSRPELIQSSFTHVPDNSSIIPSTNGFIFAATEAYAGHHHLTIRPDDIWFAILTQFSSYVNAHGEDLRHQFVAHEGKKELRLKYDALSRWHLDYSVFALDMSRELENHVVDRTLKDWVIPAFTTTTRSDHVAASVIMMGMLQKYFDFTVSIVCGLPSVTLLGERSDYEEILNRIAKLSQYGNEPTEFARLLSPILRHLILSFDDSKTETVNFFWRRIFTIDDKTCGVDLFTGWIAAFAFWDEHGQQIYQPYGTEKQWVDNDGTFGWTDISKDESYESYVLKPLLLELDGVRYGAVNRRNIAPGWTKVPVKIDDHGTEVEAEMVAGSTGYECSSSGSPAANGTVGLDSMRPVTGWWIEEKMPQTSKQKSMDDESIAIGERMPPREKDEL